MEEDEKGLRDILAPSVEDRVRFKKAVNDYAYYVIIVIISLVGMFVPPLCFGCINGDMAMNFPKTPEAWVLWGVLNGSVAMCNVAILVLFKRQARKNVRNDPNYLEACRIMNRLAGRKDVFVPRSPSSMDARDYIKKGATIVIFTCVSFAAIAPLILSFDVVTLLSTVISVSVSLCTSWACMIRNEEYWTEEYLLYAKLKEGKQKPDGVRGKEEEHDPNQREGVPEPTGAGLEERGDDPLPAVGPEDHGDGANAAA